MNWVPKIFRTKPPMKSSQETKYTSDYFEGKEAFKIGRKLYSDSVLKSFSPARRKQKVAASLEFLDQAIERGYDYAEVFSFRGMCLRDLNYDLDALEDFDKCIEKEPERASFYYDRAITRQFVYDYEGSLADFEKAIALSKIDNENTRFWDEYARRTGYNSGTHKYEFDLQFMLHDKELIGQRLRSDLLEDQQKKRTER